MNHFFIQKGIALFLGLAHTKDQILPDQCATHGLGNYGKIEIKTIQKNQ